jgi:hypothetical protein
MRYIILVILVALIAACASSPATIDTPYSSYERFKNSLSNKDIEESLSLLSRFNTNRYKGREENESFEYFFPFFSSIDTVVVNEENHFESIQNNQACLTVIGFDEKNEPTSISFQLLNEGGAWKLNLVHMIYYESSSEFPSNAVCPQHP